ncbi:hypothetical protein [Sporomusa malonica]|uniref:Uncharacterized protein n=1 Tax=Sporomusa malonica TaxID=112901 RepID=A0A1W2C643_9FIRM|nr:hypothetical protein [Sporomusa malonica]SMC80342.1 hypothetical protein SAMN04488500_109145 [Sporomusa malonica]
MKHNKNDNICGGNACPDDLEIPNGKSVASQELEEKELLSSAMSSYYLLYR